MFTMILAFGAYTTMFAVVVTVLMWITGRVTKYPADNSQYSLTDLHHIAMLHLVLGIVAGSVITYAIMEYISK